MSSRHKKFHSRDSARPNSEQRSQGVSLSGISVTDLDGVRINGKDAGGRTLLLQRYTTKPQTIMLLEEKRHSNPARTDKSPVTFAQRDSLHLIDQMLRFAGGHWFKTYRGRRSVLYLGCHLVMFEANGMNDGRVWWNGHAVSREEYERLMLMELDPRLYVPTPQVMRFWFAWDGAR